MEYTDLSTHQKYLLRNIATSKDYKSSGLDLVDCNYLTSQKILEYGGGLRYNLTAEGHRLVQADEIYASPMVEETI